jgi:hypothetical protein
MAARAAAGEFFIGGCIIGMDDPSAGCPECGASLWPDGTFAHRGMRSVLLGSGHGPGASGLRARISADRRLEVTSRLPAEIGVGPGAGNDGERVTTVRSAERALVLVMLCVERFATTEDLDRFCRSYRFPVTGTMSGPITRFAVGNDGSLVATGVGHLELHADVIDRFTLAVLADLWRPDRFITESDWRFWLTEHGVEFLAFPDE